MPKKQIIAVITALFVCFGILLSIGIAIEAKDEASHLERSQYDLESRIESLEKRTGIY